MIVLALSATLMLMLWKEPKKLDTTMAVYVSISAMTLATVSAVTSYSLSPSSLP